MTDHHGKTTTGPAVNVRPPTDAKRRHGTDYCAIVQIAVNRDNVRFVQVAVQLYCTLYVPGMLRVEERWDMGHEI